MFLLVLLQGNYDMSKIPIPPQAPADSNPAPRGPEETICKLKPSMWRNRPFFFALCILTICSVAAAAPYGRVPLYISLALAATSALILLVWSSRCASTELTITTRRCILRHGILSRFTTEMRHSDIRNIQVSQNLFQRIFGVGYICISSELQDDHDLQVSGLPHPDHIAETIRKMQP
jgi:hypothetical protein